MMRVFVTGATGFVGQAVVSELLASGHSVAGLARTAEAARKLAARGVEPVRGRLQDGHVLAAAAAKADGVIHLAFMHSPAKAPLGSLMRILLGGAPSGIVTRFMEATMATEEAALAALGGALAGSHRPFVTTFATMGVAGNDTAPRPATEEDGPNADSPGFARAKLEQKVEALAARGVRATMIRLAPSVHGVGDGGLVPEIIKFARKNGRSVYVGDGTNRWPAVPVQDAARLFRLALEHGVAGRRYHAVAEDGVPFHTIAETVARKLDVPVVSGPPEVAAKHFGWLAPFAACDNPCSSDISRRDLGWSPRGPSLLEDLDRSDYYDGQ